MTFSDYACGASLAAQSACRAVSSPVASARQVVTLPEIKAQAHRQEPTWVKEVLGHLSRALVRVGSDLMAWLGRVLGKVVGASNPPTPSLLTAMENMGAARPDTRAVLQGFMSFLAVQEQSWMDHVESLDLSAGEKVERRISTDCQLEFIEQQMLAQLDDDDFRFAAPALGGPFGARVLGVLFLALDDMHRVLSHKNGTEDSSRLQSRLMRAGGLMDLLSVRTGVAAPAYLRLEYCDLTPQEQRWMNNIFANAGFAIR